MEVTLRTFLCGKTTCNVL